MQVSTGHLVRPEASEPGNSKAVSIGQWDTSLVFGHNKKTEGHATSSWLAESVLQFGGRKYVTGRAESVDKDELFAGEDVSAAIEHGVFRIRALTLGYSRDLITTSSLSGALGANVTAYSVPGAIKPYYGSKPHSFYLFVRVRGGSSSEHGVHSMHM